MNELMREALVVALSTHSSEGQFKLAAIAFFKHAREEGMVLDDFLRLKAGPVVSPLRKLLTPELIRELESERMYARSVPEDTAIQPGGQPPLSDALRRNISALDRQVEGQATPARVPSGGRQRERFEADGYDWSTEAGWLKHWPNHPERKQHQHAFMLEQGKKLREGGFEETVGLEELCSHSLWFGQYKAWYLVEVPSGYFEYLIKSKAHGGRSDFKISDRVWLAFETLLEARNQDELPSVPGAADSYSPVEWQPLSAFV